MPLNTEMADPIKYLILVKFNFNWIVFSEFKSLEEARSELRLWRSKLGWNLKLVQEISGD